MPIVDDFLSKNRVEPFTSFKFSVEVNVPGVSEDVCRAAFFECDGLEMTMEVKTLKEGGNNARQIRLTGPTAFGQLSLKRGMTTSFDLWGWMEKVQTDPSLRADVDVVLFGADNVERARFKLSRCVPVKLKGPGMNGKDGMVAVEELGLAYESLKRLPPRAAGR